VGLRRTYYQELHEDALIMWTDDVRSAEFQHRLERVANAMPEFARPA
jgi:hypothetical protein